MVDTDYFDDIKAFQKQMDEQLRTADGWLTLVGLHWLQEGENTVGADPGCTVPLPAGTAPKLVGTIMMIDKKVTFSAAPGVNALVGEQPVVGEIELESDLNRNQTVISVDEISFYLVIRGTRYGVRVKQENSPVRMNFDGRVWWPVDEGRRVTAEIEYYEPQKIVEVPDILGNVNETAMDCALKFQLDGRTYTLDAFGLPSGQYYILFQDLSCGNGSYPAGRFLVTEYPEDDSVVIDFNKAHNPPCAFTAYATCPLPPKQNHLSIAIQAGERYNPIDGHH